MQQRAAQKERRTNHTGIKPGTRTTFPQCKTPTTEGWRFFLGFQGDILVANRGIEPRTRGFSIRCSTN